MIAPTTSENATIMYAVSAITVTAVRESVVGSGSPSVTYVINYGDTRDIADGTIVASHAANSTTGTNASLNTTSIPAGNYIWITTSATNGTINDFHVNITYKQ